MFRKKIKMLVDMRCGSMDAHPPHVWGSRSMLFCDGHGLR